MMSMQGIMIQNVTLLTCTPVPHQGTSSCPSALAYMVVFTLDTTYRLAYTPGTRASLTALGRGDSHRSGFHSFASSPQIALFVLHPRRLRKMVVPLGTGTSVRTVPSVQRTGSESGITVSTLVL